MRDAQFREKYQENIYFRDAFDTQYTVSMALLTERSGREHVLDWLRHTEVTAGALALWNDERSVLSLVSSFESGAEVAPAGNADLDVQLLPPQALIRAAQANADHVVFTVPVRHGSSDWGWLSVVGPIEDKAYIGRESISQWAALLAVALDVGVNRRKVADLGRELSVILDGSPDAVARYDADLRYRYINRAAANTLRVDASTVIGSTDAELGRYAEFTDEWTNALRQVVSSVADVELEFSETAGEDTRWYQARMVPLVDADGLLTGVLSSSRDISDLKRAEIGLAHQALHDSLTGLANRVLFLERLGLAIARLERLPGTLAVLFIDLDHFKEVNDGLGHEAGDRLLIQVANRLLKLSRRSDTLARFGGDEFVLLCDRLAEDEDVRVIGERLVRTLAEPFHDGPHELVVSASIGIFVIEDAGADVSTVMRHADQAMYSAKARGRDRFHVYDPDLHERASARHSLEVDLRHALERGELSLAYQPLFALSSGTVLGVEALLRWQHPTRGDVPPDQFIGLAEQRGLIVPIGAWVLDEALRQLAEWSEHEDLAGLGLAINVSGRQFAEPGIVQTIADALRRHGIDPTRITLEITETTLIEEGSGIRETLAAVTALGVRLALDDFGTGYSSLVHLRDFTVDTLKIDRSFVAQLGTGTRAREIIGALTAMAHFLDMNVVGEGIEQQAQWDTLRDLGCDDGQGFLVAEPLPPAGVLNFMKELAAHRADPVE